MNLAPGCAAAACGGLGRGRGALVGEGLHARALRRASRIAATMFGIGGAAADVAAHPLADLGVAQRRRRPARSAVTWLGQPALDLGQHADRRADLARRAVAALEAVMLDEGRLHRMQLVAGAPSPSMVVISSPSCITASVRQELMRRPSTSTVQAPHWPWSQPFLVPVRRQMLAQRVEQGGARYRASAPGAVPLTVKRRPAAWRCPDPSAAGEARPG